MSYLCKSLPTRYDLLQLREENRQLRDIITRYIKGEASLQEFLVAKKRVKDLLFLAERAELRVRKSALRTLK